MEIDMFKFSNSNEVNLVTWISLGNYPFHAFFIRKEVCKAVS